MIWYFINWEGRDCPPPNEPNVGYDWGPFPTYGRNPNLKKLRPLTVSCLIAYACHYLFLFFFSWDFRHNKNESLVGYTFQDVLSTTLHVPCWATHFVTSPTEFCKNTQLIIPPFFFLKKRKIINIWKTLSNRPN